MKIHRPYLAILSLALLLGGCYSITIEVPPHPEGDVQAPGDDACPPAAGQQPDADDPDADDPDADDPDADDQQSLNGADIFVANACSACHGDNGDTGFAPGIRGVDFADIDWLRGPYTTHSGGQFPDLSDEEMDALVDFLSDIEPPADQPPVDQPNPPPDATVGWAFIANGCFACHGDDGSKHGIRGLDFAELNSELRDPSTKHPGGWFDLTDEEMEDIVVFLASTGSPSDDDNPDDGHHNDDSDDDGHHDSDDDDSDDD